MIMLRCAIALSAFAFIAGGTANAIDKIPPAPVDWKVSKNFEGRDARTNLSGAACKTGTPPFASCLIVNDEEQYAQFFSITGTTIKPGKVIRLRDNDSDGDPDGEGAA